MKPKRFLLDLLISLIISLLLNIALSWIALPSYKLLSHDFLTFPPFWSGTLILFLLFNVFFFLKRSWYLTISFFLFVLIGCFGYANSIKMEKRSDPIVPNDIYLLKESWAMSKQYVSTRQILYFVIAFILFLVAAFFIIRKKWKPSAPIGYRLLISAICIASIFALGSVREDKVWNKLGVSNKITMPAQNLSDNGFVMGNFLQLTAMYQQKPEGYAKSTVEKTINKYEKNSESNYASTKSIDVTKPNLIVLQLEAFFDPTTLPNVTFSEDPIPFYHSLQQRYTNGKLGVNVFGAGTANTEFEVLTSMSLQLFPYETHPFTSHVIQPMDSVVYRLKDYGYKSSGLHNNVGWFYKRTTAWPNLGIDYMEFSDKMFEDKNVESVYDVPAVPKDYVLFDNIIKRTKKTKGLDYVLGITMETHGPYTKWYDHDIKVTSDTVPKRSTDIIEEYAFKMRELDKALERLMNYYENSDEPTMIVMYGDHLPWLGDDKMVYYDTGYGDDSQTTENRAKMYATPFLIWDNYRNKEKEEFNLGSTFLMPYVLKEIGVKGNGLQSFLQEQMSKGIIQLPPEADQKQEGWTTDTIKQYRYMQYYYLNEPSAVKK
ncbi:LTA synthase family protein [Bacillus salipaludis]|uniref:LTA synthase family protein n=1 Tax=Bacillus salipaludis TaxID=2547811 RepID=A0ABW8RCR1_9BACI